MDRMMRAYDVAVIGGGPAGYVAAIRAAQLKANVCLIEKGDIGGTCLNRGCIPTKVLVASANRFMDVRNSEDFGIHISNVIIDYKKIVERKDRVVSHLVKGIYQLLKGNKIDLIKGKGQILNPKMINVIMENNEEIKINAAKIIIATGSESADLPGLKIDHKFILSSEDVLNIHVLPKSLAIVGAGPVGVEFAHIFSSYGVKVVLIELLSQVLPEEDAQISRILMNSMKKRGIRIVTSATIEDTKTESDIMIMKLSTGEEIKTDKILLSVGRILNTSGIGLEVLSLKGDKGNIATNERKQTLVENIYAAGDVCGPPYLAHVASMEGIVAAENAMGYDSTMDYSAIPSCVFTYPEIASVGLREKQAHEIGIDIITGKFPFAANGKAISMGETEGFVKIIADAKNDMILGMQVIGPHASDLIAEGTLAIRRRLTVKELIQTVHCHPTLSETLMEAAHDAHKSAIHILH